jgi:hypothetical protein
MWPDLIEPNQNLETSVSQPVNIPRAGGGGGGGGGVLHIPRQLLSKKGSAAR